MTQYRLTSKGYAAVETLETLETTTEKILLTAQDGIITPDEVQATWPELDFENIVRALSLLEQAGYLRNT